MEVFWSALGGLYRTRPYHTDHTIPCYTTLYYRLQEASRRNCGASQALSRPAAGTGLSSKAHPATRQTGEAVVSTPGAPERAASCSIRLYYSTTLLLYYSITILPYYYDTRFPYYETPYYSSTLKRLQDVSQRPRAHPQRAPSRSVVVL